MSCVRSFKTDKIYVTSSADVTFRALSRSVTDEDRQYMFGLDVIQVSFIKQVTYGVAALHGSAGYLQAILVNIVGPLLLSLSTKWHEQILSNDCSRRSCRLIYKQIVIV